MRIPTLAFAAFAAMTGMATAAPPCPNPEAPDDGLAFFMGIRPSDGPYEAWCRIQSLGTDVKLTVAFPKADAQRSTRVKLGGEAGSPEWLETYLRSLIPVAEGPAKDADGMPFPKVIASTVQAVSKQGTGGIPPAIPNGHPAADSLILWQPIVLRVTPVRLAGTNFSLTLTFAPSFGRFLMAVEGHTAPMTLSGWRGRLPLGNRLLGGDCSPEVPLCKALPETVEVHTPWILHAVILDASGEGLSSTAETVLSAIQDQAGTSLESSTLDRFDPVRGEAKVFAQSGPRSVTAEAVAGPGDVSGTQAIRITYRENTRSTASYATRLQSWFEQRREEMVRRYGAPSTVGDY